VTLITLRTAASRISFRRLLLLSATACLVFAPGALRATTIKVSEVPAAANVAGGTVESSGAFETRARSLTTDLVSLLTGAEMNTFDRGVSNQYFTLDNARSSDSESSSVASRFSYASYSVGVPAARYSTPAPSLIGWSLAKPASSGQSKPVVVTALAVPAQTITAAPAVVETGHKHKKGKAQLTSSAPSNPFTQPNNEFGLSVAGDNTIQVHKISFDGGKGDGTPSAVPEPRFNSLLLFAGLMSAAFVYRRKSSAA
jgi:hypothetical protein